MRTQFLALMLIAACAVGATAADINADGMETILLPLAFTPSGDEIAGAFGTVWTGMVWMHNRSDVTIGLLQCMVPCHGYEPGSMGVVGLPLGRRPELGLLLHVPSPYAGSLTFTNRIFERTRLGQPRGVNIPVVREGEFMQGINTLLAIPVGGGVRAGIRLYDPWITEVTPSTPRLNSLTIEVLGVDQVVLGSATVTPVVVFREVIGDPHRPGFAAIHDLATIVPDINAREFVHVRVTPNPAGAQYYAMVAVTDNDTQTVSIITAD